MANPDILQKIADAAKLSPKHAVLEVGPGTGNLTRCLLGSGASVTAVEKDRRLIKRLSAEFPEASSHPDCLFLSLLDYCVAAGRFFTSLQVNIIEADILTYDLESCLDRMIQKQGYGATLYMVCVKSAPLLVSTLKVCC